MAIKKQNKIKNKKAQIWVETVVYTLIVLTLIGMVLAVARPAIEKQKDKAIIEQTIVALNDFDRQLMDAKNMGAGNVRIIDFRIKKGKFIIDANNNKIIFEIDDSRYQYSEYGVDIILPGSNLEIRTDKGKKYFKVTLTLNYASLNITYNGKEEKGIFPPAPYKFSIENKGNNVIDIREIS